MTDEAAIADMARRFERLTEAWLAARGQRRQDPSGSGGAMSWRTAANSVLMFESCAVTARSNSSNLIRTFL